MIKVLPYALGLRNAGFQFGDCCFGLGKGKEGTARVVGFKEIGIMNSYTLECSFYGSGEI